MNWDQIAGNWKMFKGRMREKWGKLTDSDLEQIAGRRDQLIGKLQERYGWEKEEAQRQLESWETSGEWEKGFEAGKMREKLRKTG